MEIYLVAVQWIGLALVASLISVRLGVSIALVEIMVGMVAGNLWAVPQTEWTGFLASVGAVILTFLAGVDIDTKVLRSKLLETASIGFLSFLVPFVGALAWAYWVARWDLQASLIAVIALSTTSVAVVYGEYTRGVIHGHPANALIEHARREEFDLLVIGRKGHSALERFLLGSVIQELAAHAPCPLLIVPKREQ